MHLQREKKNASMPQCHGKPAIRLTDQRRIIREGGWGGREGEEEEEEKPRGGKAPPYFRFMLNNHFTTF